MLLKIFMLVLFIMASETSFTEAKGWRGIIPLQSKRADVVRLLGQPAEPGGYGVLYKLEEEIVFIEYSSGPCSKDREGGWNVARDTVVSISVTPKKKLQFTDLNLGDNYRKGPSGDVIDIVNYTNEQDGVIYEVDDNTGIIRAISFQPGIENRHLLCTNPTVN